MITKSFARFCYSLPLKLMSTFFSFTCSPIISFNFTFRFLFKPRFFAILYPIRVHFTSRLVNIVEATHIFRIEVRRQHVNDRFVGRHHDCCIRNLSD